MNISIGLLFTYLKFVCVISYSLLSIIWPILYFLINYNFNTLVEMTKFTRLPVCVPLPIPENQLKEIVSKAKDWAIMHGISMRCKASFSEDIVQISPFILFPTGFPHNEFNKVIKLQTIFQELLHKIANNRQFVQSCFKEIIEVDDFTARLYNIYETVEAEGYAQKISMVHLRSDYLMQSSSNNNLKQVEFNTVASSFASLATRLTQYNRYILEELGYYDKVQNIPENNALTNVAVGFIEAWKLFNNPNAAIVVIVIDNTHNISDQRLVEFEIKRLNPQTKIMRRSFSYINKNGSLNDKKELVIDNTVAAVIYFREGYNPSNFPTQGDWDARLMIERSSAIKCPDIKYHLVGQKKVQQELSKPGVLELFFTDTKKIAAIREVFVNMHGLEFDETGNKAVAVALEHPERYVLKPQREGGGNNYYDNDIIEVLSKTKDTKERTGYILMERIFPPVTQGYMIVPGMPNPPPLVELVSEIGIYGILISDQEKIIINNQGGHMIRSKVSTSNEGGVLAGAGALDCPYLLV